MWPAVFHRDRVAKHTSHYKVDCIADTPKSVKRKSRRSLRAAEKRALKRELEQYDGGQ